MVREPTSGTDQARFQRKGIIRLFAGWIVMPLFFFVTGGSLSWWQAWVYCALLLVPMTVFVIWMAGKDPEFFERRFEMREKERVQRRIQAWATPLFIVYFTFPGLDYRFGWSDPPPAIVVAALIISLGAYLMVLRVFLENRWAGRTVDTWDDQKVIDSGPYAIVRHPMYTAVLTLILVTPVALGSWWSIIGALGFFPIFVLRVRNEEEVLLRELPAYEDYRTRVRYRIIPLIW